ncbi:PilW family protein [Bordetella holmesii]|nr:prepilin-type N-terminal cleavage/methylation domain-containing protein [Bordetella holmesii]AMD44578.1 pilus assembly protein [Bordetella holmesii H558]AOB36682.1 pilus assembly protein [Bordetella holmesii]AUL20641.1 pilus assembly protein [Bordetella holmesii]AUL23967.1 pilus assembly protein [Bordetella holmesii]AUL27293.1 pilus assembly protein [Bordetella holmesii]
MSRRQQGFALLELVVALSIGLLVAVYAAGQWARQAEEAAARASGQWMEQVRLALEQALARDLGGWAGGTSTTALFADPRTPTLDELKKHGLLPVGFPVLSPLGFGVRMLVLSSEQCPSEHCRVDGLVVADRALRTRSGQADLMRLGALLQPLGAAGGYARPALQGAQFSYPNPPRADLPVVPLGTPLGWAGSHGGLDPRYVRVGDDRDPRLQAGLTVAGSIVAGDRLSAGGYLQAGARRVLGRACGTHETGALAQGDQGELLQCHRGRWRPGEGSFGGTYGYNNRTRCALHTGQSMLNPVSGGCHCPTGFKAVPVSYGGKWTETEGWTTGFVCVRPVDSGP